MFWLQVHSLPVHVRAAATRPLNRECCTYLFIVRAAYEMLWRSIWLSSTTKMKAGMRKHEILQQQHHITPHHAKTTTHYATP
jgi:hypothetical protein